MWLARPKAGGMLLATVHKTHKLLYFALAVWLVSVCYHLGKGTADLIGLCRAT